MSEFNFTVTDNVHFIKIQGPKRYSFTPQNDITPLESAYIAHFFAVIRNPYVAMEQYEHWSLISKHFTEIP